MLGSPALWLLTKGQDQEAQSGKDKESATAPNKGKLALGRSPQHQTTRVLMRANQGSPVRSSVIFSREKPGLQTTEVI